MGTTSNHHAPYDLGHTCLLYTSAPVLLDGLSQEEILMENPDYIFISTSDAHSPQKLGREANLFHTPFSLSLIHI